MTVNKSVNIDELIKKLQNIFIQSVFPALEKHNDEKYVAEYLLAHIVSSKSLIFLTAEYLLIIIANSFPERIDEILGVLRSKAKDSNDRLFISEMLGELGIAD